jgi:hypothetical protein
LHLVWAKEKPPKWRPVGIEKAAKKRLGWGEESPGRGGFGYSGGVEFTEFMLWKALAIVALAFLAGLFGFIEPEGPASKEARDRRLE